MTPGICKIAADSRRSARDGETRWFGCVLRMALFDFGGCFHPLGGAGSAPKIFPVVLSIPTTSVPSFKCCRLAVLAIIANSPVSLLMGSEPGFLCAAMSQLLQHDVARGA